MSLEPRKLGYGEVLPRMLVVYAVMILWELFTVPAVSHSNSSPLVLPAIVTLPIGAFVLGRHPGTPSRFFVFGAAGSLLFVWRFVNMDRFSLWLQYQAPSTEIIVTCWVLFACGMGTVCWLAAKAASSHESIPSEDARSP